jgi:hypothetical protein
MRRDFASIKAQYVQGVEKDGKRVLPSLDDLAKAHGCNASNLRKRAGREKWAAARRSFAAKVQQETETKKADVIATKASALDTDAADIAERALRIIRKEVLAMEAAKEAGGGRSRVDRARLAELLAAAKQAQAVGRLALGQPLDISDRRETGEYKFDLSQCTDEQLRALAGQ